MSEDQAEQPKSAPEKQGRQAEMAGDSHADNLKEALGRAQQSNEDRVVEAAGRKGGLRGALAARMETMRTGISRYQETNKNLFLTLRKQAKNPADAFIARFGLAAAKSISELFLTPSQKVLVILRDRLQPKTQTPKAPASGK